MTRLLLVTAGGVLAGVVALAPNDGGNQWGPRYLLPVFPLVVPAAVAWTIRSDSPPGIRRALVLLFVLLGIGTQAIGAANLVTSVREKSRELAEVGMLGGRYVLTPVSRISPMRSSGCAIVGSASFSSRRSARARPILHHGRGDRSEKAARYL